MRILLVSPFYRPGVGGSSRLLQDVVDYLLKCGHVAEVLTYGSGPAEEYLKFDKGQPYPIHRIAWQRIPGTSSLLMLAKLLRLTFGGRRKFDLILSGAAYPTVFLVHVAHKLWGIPYAVYAYGEDVTCVRESPKAAARLAAKLNESQAVIAISKFTAAEVAKIGVSEKQVQVIPPGIDSAPYHRVSEEAIESLRARLGLQNKKVILTLARLAPRKGHDIIVRSLQSLTEAVPNVHYLIVGHGDPQTLRTLAQEEGVAERVTIVDYIADEELPTLFHLGDVYAMVSRWDPATREVEGFGIVYLEAGASGKPCVAGSHGGSSDAVENEVTGFVVDPTSVTEVQSALRALLTDDALAQKMGEAGRERVQQEFDRTTLLQRIEGVLVTASKK